MDQEDSLLVSRVQGDKDKADSKDKGKRRVSYFYDSEIGNLYVLNERARCFWEEWGKN